MDEITGIYAKAGKWWKVVRALAMTESNENSTAVGDGGQAFGILQQHPAFFVNWYTPTTTSDQWVTAQIIAAAAFLDYAVGRFGLEGAIQAYNTGCAAYKSGVRNENYLTRWMQNYAKLGGSLGPGAPVGALTWRAVGLVARRFDKAA